MFIENRAVYEIMWKNIAKPERPQTKIWRVRIACCISRATDTHSECVIQFVHCNNGCMNVLQCYVIRTLPVLIHRTWIHSGTSAMKIASPNIYRGIGLNISACHTSSSTHNHLPFNPSVAASVRFQLYLTQDAGVLNVGREYPEKYFRPYSDQRATGCE